MNKIKNSLKKLILLLLYILFFIIIVILLIFRKRYNRNCFERELFKTVLVSLQPWNENSPVGGFPFQALRHSDGHDLKIAVLCAPLYDDQFERFYKLKKDGYLMIGITSYGFYPMFNEEDSKYDSRAAQLKNEKMKDILKDIHCWLTCSREKLPYNVPQLLFSESDCPINMDALKPKGLNKKYDVVYNACSDLEFHEYHKNWKLAQPCIKKMNDMGLKVLVIGRQNIPEDMKLPNVEYLGFLEWFLFIDKIEESRVIFVPNISDASPRIITEALCKGTPIVVNNNIFGGWKYVNENTGQFFNDENDIIPNLEKVLNNQKNGKYDTRKWFMDNYFPNGESIKKKELAEFILKIYENFNNNKKEYFKNNNIENLNKNINKKLEKFYIK